MKLYIYNIKSKKIIAIAHGNTDTECEQKAIFHTSQWKKYAATYSPWSGLHENPDAETL